MTTIQHDIALILEARLPHLVALGPQIEPRFLVEWNCECCRGRRDWITRTQLASTSNFPEQRIRHLEESIKREQRERETRTFAEELTRFLDFEDVEDFMMLTPKDFEEKNFYANQENTEKVTSTESYFQEDGVKEDNSLQVLLQGLTNNSLKKHNNETTMDGSLIVKMVSQPSSSLELDQIEVKSVCEEGKDS
jgi:hypothetical protein